MKFSIQLLAAAQATHYRAGSYEYKPNGSTMQVRRTMGWRRGFAGYGADGCTEDHVNDQTVSDPMITEQIFDLATGTEIIPFQSAGTAGTYIVSEIEQSEKLDPGVHYCFGHQYEEFAISKPFAQRSFGCCTIEMNDDDGTVFKDGDYKFVSAVYDLTNNSPSFRIPAIWYIMFGCPDQRLHLSPSDADGDNIRCRWATIQEADQMSREIGNFNSFELDEENCIVTYIPENDNFGAGIKPLAIQVEDFDANGNIRSSMPAQFMATVWTPEMPDAGGNGSTGGGAPAALFSSSSFATTHDHSHEALASSSRKIKIPKAFKPRGRRQADLPPYCSGLPTFTGDTPADGEIIEVFNEINIDFFALYMLDDDTNFDMDRIIFSTPAGMICTEVDKVTGKSTCSWTPTEEQRLVGEFDLCAIAYDPLNRNTDQICVTLRVSPAITTAPPTTTTEMTTTTSATTTTTRTLGTGVEVNTGGFDIFTHDWLNTPTIFPACNTTHNADNFLEDWETVESDWVPSLPTLSWVSMLNTGMRDNVCAGVFDGHIDYDNSRSTRTLMPSFAGVKCYRVEADGQCAEARVRYCCPAENPTTTTSTTTTTTSTTTTTTTTARPRTTLTFWIDTFAPNFNSTSLTNYGCTGRGLLEPFTRNAGRPVDAVDLAINAWKKCNRCSVDILYPATLLTSGWDYPLPLNGECFANTDFEKAICECDKALANALANENSPNPAYQNYDEKYCSVCGGASLQTETKCCATEVGSFQQFSVPSEQCCEDNRLKPIGTCENDESIIYTSAVKMF